MDLHGVRADGQVARPAALTLPIRARGGTGESGKYAALEEKNFVLRAFELLAKSRPMHNPLVLDVGTGQANIPVRFVHQLSPASLVALDQSPGLLKKARENIRTKRLTGRIYLVCADPERLPFREGTFDLVCCHSALRRFSGLPGALEEIVRVTRKGCRFLIRDLRRPPARLLGWYVRIFGLGLDQFEKKLLLEGLRSGYTSAELKKLTRRVRGALFRTSGFFLTHVGLEGIRTRANPGTRPAAAAARLRRLEQEVLS